ncbi:3565_t:CDS:2 [Ambispora gerdemannii]|uniref:3565_t:CDS:1 n=1 Tax=Ambispora gerdemannii TaxID=144530 RepID=A0A9N9GVK6_9GLOM|nr:3565_t:CDS:2 [Ambispora gerdemannii]
MNFLERNFMNTTHVSYTNNSNVTFSGNISSTDNVHKSGASGHENVLLANLFALLSTLFSSVQLVPQVKLLDILFFMYQYIKTGNEKPQLCIYYEDQRYKKYQINAQADLEKQNNATNINHVDANKSNILFRKYQFKCFAYFGILIFGYSLIEFAGVVLTKIAQRRGINWFKAILGIVPSVFVFVGFIPQFYEIYRLKKVRGISLVFMTMDITGASLAIISLVFSPQPFNIISSAVFICITSCDGLILILYFVLGRTKQRREEKLPANPIAIVSLE